MSRDASDPRWAAAFVSTIVPASPRRTACKGTLVLRRAAARLVLLDEDLVVIDARYLRAGERVLIGSAVELPAHTVTPAEILPVDSGDPPLQSNGSGPIVCGQVEILPARGNFGISSSAMDAGNGSLDPMGQASPAPEGQTQQKHVNGGTKVLSPTSASLRLESILSHFWEKPRVSSPPCGDSFGWWQGKVRGDQRSFAQVASSPPRQQPRDSGARVVPSRSMGDHGGNSNAGGRFYGHRGGYGGRNPQGGRAVPNNNNLKPYVWNRGVNDGEEDGRQGDRNRDKQNQRQSGGAVRDLGLEQSDVAPRMGYKSGAQKGKLIHENSSNNSEPCFNCNIVGHFAASCPTIRCVRCKKLGHIRELCQTVLPWECIPSMCGFQTPVLGFFYFPDDSDGKQVKEKASSVVISVLEGNPTFRDVEIEFNAYFGGGWRCTARAISPNQFTMRFPNSIEVDKTGRFGKRMEMATFNGVLSVQPWSAAAGAKAELHKAWVRVKNIPNDKRCDATAAYVGSLVGVTLEIDQATLHKPEYCRVLIGCRDIQRLPVVAEGVLGDYFYDFYYEVESILVGGPQKEKNAIVVNSQADPSPKRSRIEHSSSEDPSNNSTEFSDNIRSDYRDERGRRTHTVVLDPVIEEVSEEDSQEDQGLLIDQLAKEGQCGGKNLMESAKQKSETEISQDQGSEILRDVSNGGIMVGDSQETVQSAEEIINENKHPDENVNTEANRMLVEDADQRHVPDTGREGKEKTEASSQAGSSSSVNMGSLMVVSAWAPVTPMVNQESPIVQYDRKNLREDEWPHLVNITEVEVEGSVSPIDTTKYSVQTPDNSPVLEHMSVTNEDIPRNQAQKMKQVMEQAANISRKRNLEGLYGEEEREFIKNGAQQLVWKAMEIARRSSEQGQVPESSTTLRITGG